MKRIYKRIQNTLFVLASFVYVLFRGNAQSKVSSPRTFVVINPTGNIGDMVCTTPLFRAIKRHNPDSRLIVLGSPKNQLMMAGSHDIDRYISLDISFFHLIRELRKENIDIGILVNQSALDFSLLFLADVKSISCFTLSQEYKRSESRSYQVISSLGFRIPYIPGTYVPGQYLKLLTPYNIMETDIQKHLWYTEEANVSVTKQLRESSIDPKEYIVAIAPGAGTKIKQWPASRFAEVANYIAKKYHASIAIIGGPNDTDEVKRMIAGLTQDTRYCNFVGQSLDELKATLSKVGLIIGNDSGSIYIAESFGAKTLVLVGPTDEAEHPLQDETHRVVTAREKGNALLQSFLSAEDSIDLSTARAQIEAITVAQVLKEVDDLLTIH